MSDSPEAYLQLKKRARRRLVGAVAFAGLAAVVLPMVMDEEPKPPVQDVRISIPGQDETPFVPKVAKRAEKKPDEKAATRIAGKSSSEPAEKTPEKNSENSAVTPLEKSIERVAEKPLDKAVPGDKRAAVAVERTAKGKAADGESQRAAEILGGKGHENAAASGGQYVILIGAFANPANVRQLQTKIGELGIKVYTEPLDSPEGRKTRVRAGPFPNRDAAGKALEKIRRIGVNGVVAVKQ